MHIAAATRAALVALIATPRGILARCFRRSRGKTITISCADESTAVQTVRYIPRWSDVNTKRAQSDCTVVVCLCARAIRKHRSNGREMRCCARTKVAPAKIKSIFQFSSGYDVKLPPPPGRRPPESGMRRTWWCYRFRREEAAGLPPEW